MSLEQKITSYFERKIYGSGTFHVQAATLRTLIKFFEDHQSPVPADSALRGCLAALEAGEKSNAIATYKRIYRGGMHGIADWFPPVACSCETEESVYITFTCLVTTWLRQMDHLEAGRH